MTAHKAHKGSEGMTPQSRDRWVPRGMTVIWGHKAHKASEAMTQLLQVPRGIKVMRDPMGRKAIKDPKDPKDCHQ